LNIEIMLFRQTAPSHFAIKERGRFQKRSQPKVLVYSPSASGGIAEHTFYQATALERAGAKVVCLVPSSFLGSRKTDFEQEVCLPNPFPEGSSGITRKLSMVWRIIFSRLVLALQIIKHRPDLVLLDSYVEYLSLFWIWPHWFLSKVCGVCYAANLHDPIRSYVVGPKWWHRLSVQLAYLPLDFVLVHYKLPDPSPVPSRIPVIEVPVGLYEISSPAQSAKQIRSTWGVRDGQKVFLSVGYVRDQKNLDLAVQALVGVPEAFLVIAGSVASSHDRPFSYYHDLASRLGVSGRCKFFEGFVPDEELGKYFAAADFVLLTYSSSFHSQSGVLSIAARARKPVVASAAPSPLLDTVRDYSLGVTIPPDSLDSVIQGMQKLIINPPSPRWYDYEAFASWDQNARKILEACKYVSTN
jgi:glycosyltransferase involved in cell wall biosynthesis